MEELKRYKTRMRFTKTGSVRFLGHLDLMRFFQKAVRRANLRVSYSKGFSPHQLMSFASPLSVGATTDGDYIDIEFEPDEAEPDVLMERLNSCLTDEIFITAAERMPDGFKNSMSELKYAAYMITDKFDSGSQTSYTDISDPLTGGKKGFPDDHRTVFDSFAARESIPFIKKTKKSEREIDLKPAIITYAYELSDFEKKLGEKLPELHPVYTGESIFLKLPASSDNTVKPEQIMDAFFAYASFDPAPYGYQIHRLQMWF